MWQSIAKATTTAPKIALIRQLSLACRSSITRRIRNVAVHFSCVALMEPRERVSTSVKFAQHFELKLILPPALLNTPLDLRIIPLSARKNQKSISKTP